MMRKAFLACLIVCCGMVKGQDIVTGLVEPCQDEINDYFPPGASLIGAGAFDFTPKEHETVDLSEYLPAIGDQGIYGACTAFSVSAALTIIKNQKEKRKYSAATFGNAKLFLSPAFIFNLGKAQYPIPRRTNCSDGISFIDAFNVVRDFGVPSGEDFNYEIHGNVGCDYSLYYPSEKVKTRAAKNKLYTFQRVRPDLKTFQFLLSKDPSTPINIAVTIDKNYQAASDDPKKEGRWLEKGKPLSEKIALHAMVIVGYSEDKKCFKVLDSRGPLKGDKGYLWLSYDLISTGVIYDSYICSFTDEILKIKAQNTSEASEEVEYGKPYKSWVKQGYYRTFNGIRIACTEINKEKNEVRILIRDRANYYPVIDTPKLSVNQERVFEALNTAFSIRLNSIGHAGTNPFKPAAHFEITFRGMKVVEQYDEELAKKGYAKLGSALENYLDQEDLIYAGSKIRIGDILDMKTTSLIYTSPDSIVTDFSVEGSPASLGISGTDSYSNSLLFSVGDSLRKHIINTAQTVRYVLGVNISVLRNDQFWKSLMSNPAFNRKILNKENYDVVVTVVRVHNLAIMTKRFDGKDELHIVLDNLPVYFKYVPISALKQPTGKASF